MFSLVPDTKMNRSIPVEVDEFGTIPQSVAETPLRIFPGRGVRTACSRCKEHER